MMFVYFSVFFFNCGFCEDFVSMQNDVSQNKNNDGDAGNISVDYSEVNLKERPTIPNYI